MTFSDWQLPKALQKAIDTIGYIHPTPIQQRAMPVVSSGRDVIGIAQTGTGKTWAYLLPILKHWKFQNTHTPRVIILVPTRELVVQVLEEVQKLSEYMSVRSLGVYGGTNINTQRAALMEGVDVLVGTPGRTLDLALDGNLQLGALQKLVLDEFDEILQLGFRPQVVQLLTMMKSKRQNILFSATMTDEVDEMIEEYFDLPEEVSLAPSGTPLEKIRQGVCKVPNFLTKINVLKHWLSQPELEKVLVYVNNKKIADLVYDALLEDGFENTVEVMHSNKSQNYRLQAIQAFQSNQIRIMVTTDVMARGLDITDVTHVINLEVPLIPEQYIHRIGRTGRAQKEGDAWTMVSKKEEDAWLEIEVLMETEVPELMLPNVEISEKLLEFEKEKLAPKFLLKRPKIEGGGAFHEKKDKNKKVNLGGPGRRNPKTASKGNRGALKANKKKK